MENNSPKPTFIIFAHSYNPDSGGVVAMHYLCHLLNKAGFESFLIPSFNSVEVSPLDSRDSLNELPTVASFKGALYKVRKGWETPLYKKSWMGIATSQNVVVIYPEVTFGNPLRAKNVARWILCQPGFHTQEVYFTRGEVHFSYAEMHRTVPMPWVEMAPQPLAIARVPWEYYSPPASDVQRSGTAYAMRKGRHRSIVHDLTNSTCIDGLTHAQIGSIFRRVKTFISYDTQTMYSSLAALAGADSVVIPIDGLCEDEWQPETRYKYGIAYGFDRLPWAISTRHLVEDMWRDFENTSHKHAADFANFWVKRLFGANVNN